MNEEDEERALIRTVREILGGKSVSDYPINMLPKIKNYLYELKEKAISLGQNDRVKLIQRAFTEIKKLEKKYQTDEFTKEITKPSDSELEALINRMISGEKIEPFNINLIPPLIKCIKKRIKFHIQKDDFEMAQNYEDLHQILLTEFRNGEKTGQKEWMQKTILERLEKAEQKLRETENAYEQKISQNEQETAEAIEKINLQNQIELHNFDAETQGPLPPFSKTFSPELQSLRETQKKLIICKRYKEAAIVRDKIKEIVEIELEGIEDKHFRSREARREQLIDNHYQRLDCILTKSESQKINIDYIFGKKINSLRKQIDFYERQLDMINTSKRLRAQFDPAVSFDISPEEFQPKVTKSKTPMSVRQLSMREPWSLLFDSSKRLNATKIDELAEPHWKTIEPRQTDTEVYSQFVSSLISTPKSWQKVHQRKVSSARSQKQNWQPNPTIYSTNRRNRSEEKRKRINMQINFNEDGSDGEFEDSNAITPNRIKKTKNKNNRSSSTSKTRNAKSNEVGVSSIGAFSSNNNFNYNNNANQTKKGSISYSDNYKSAKKGKNSNIRKSANYLSSTSYHNNHNDSNYNSKKQNIINNNTISIANSSNYYNNLVSNFESTSTANKTTNTNSIRSSNVNTLSNASNSSKTKNSLSKTVNSLSKTVTTTTQSSSDIGNIQRVSIDSTSYYTTTSNNKNDGSSAKKSKKSNKSDSMESASNIYYNGLTYTQFIDARRNKAIQTKKKQNLSNLFGENSDFEKFCQTVPPSRKEQLPSYL